MCGMRVQRKKMYILIVTGLSGAGKSTALSILEDIGFVCADNIPCQLVKQYLDLCARNQNILKKIAIVIDSRESLFGYNPLETFKELQTLDYDYDIMFLECDDLVLQRRYSETRRRHPMDDDVMKGIKREHEILAPLRDTAKYILDTTGMKPRELSRVVEGLFLKGENLPLRLIISSFGFKRGIPQNADFVFDMRYTPNPFYEKELRQLSGKDKPVHDFVFSDERVVKQLEQIENMVELLIPSFVKEGKRRIMIAFGCTGGRHRSVAMAEELHKRLADKYPVIIEHRDLIDEADDIRQRFESKPDSNQ